MGKKGKAREEAEAEQPSQLRFRSPAEFFAENKNIAGFDNPGKSLYTTIRELVENGLDAAEAIGTLPEVSVVVEELTRSEFNRIVGIDARERQDQSLYKDVETEKERKRRQAKELREEKKRKKSGNEDATKKNGKAKGGATGAKDEPTEEPPQPPEPTEPAEPVEPAAPENPAAESDAPANVPPPADSQQPGQTPDPSSQPSQPSQQPSQTSMPSQKLGRGEVSTLRVICRDNGVGMAYHDVPDMLGRVLAGTKYNVKQSRGKFGLGSKMALIWSKMSTSLPIDIRTAQEGGDITHCLLDIDISRNIPNVLVHEKLPNDENWRGTEIKVTIQGSWTTYRAKILHYMRQMAIITPYAHFSFKFSTARTDKSFEVNFLRRSDQMPPEPKEVKHHPSSVNQLLLKQLISNAPPAITLVEFLTTELSNIDRELAERLIKELGDKFSADMRAAEFGLNEIRHIDGLLKEARFTKPDGSCLSPAGEYNLRLGIIKELRPDMVATHAEPADIFEGHPFIVEVGVSLGGDKVKPGLNVYRYANRIPMLFESGNDVVTKTARESISWNQYKISTVDRIGVFCSIVSTRIPFKGTGKEYIGDDATEIKQAVRRAIQSCCIQLKTKLTRKAELKNRQERSKSLKRYAPDVANAITKFLEGIQNPTLSADYKRQLETGELSKELIQKKLIQHIEATEQEQGGDTGNSFAKDSRSLELVQIAPRAPAGDYTPVIAASVDAEKEGGEPKKATPLLSLQLLVPVGRLETGTLLEPKPDAELQATALEAT